MVLRDFSKDNDPKSDLEKPRVRVFCGEVGVGKTHTIALRSCVNHDRVTAWTPVAIILRATVWHTASVGAIKKFSVFKT